MCLEEMIKSLAEMGSTLFNIQINQMEEETMTDNFKATTTPATVINKDKNVKLAPPWSIFFEELYAMFVNDPDVIVRDMGIEDDIYKIEMLVDSIDKAEALSILIPAEKKFGNITVKVNVVPPNHKEMTHAELYRKAFRDNLAVDRVLDSALPTGDPMVYIEFSKEVVQFYADNLRDPEGFKSTLYQDIAKDIFEGKPGVCYCTSKRDMN